MANHSKSASARHQSRKEKRHSDSVVSPDKVLAEKIRLAMHEKDVIRRSTLGLYSLKTVESSFGVPFCTISDQFALTAAKQILPIANVYKVGEFCLHNGKGRFLPRPVLVLDNKVTANEKV